MPTQNRIFKLPLEERLPTLKAGDVVIGAATQVPPLKLLSLSQEGNHWRLRVQPALPKELIEKGRATFEQEIDWSGDSGEVTLVDIPPQPLLKFSGYSSLSGTIDGQEEEKSAQFSIEISPIKIPIVLTRFIYIIPEIDAEIKGFSQIRTNYSGTLSESGQYSYEKPTKWNHSSILSNNALGFNLDSRSDFEGYIDYGNLFEVKLDLFDSHYFGINFFIASEAEFDSDPVPLQSGLIQENDGSSILSTFIQGNKTLSTIGEVLYLTRLSNPLELEPRLFPSSRSVPLYVSAKKSIDFQLDTVSRSITNCFKRYPVNSPQRVECLRLLREICGTQAERARVDNLISQQTVVQDLYNSDAGRLDTDSRTPEIEFDGGAERALQHFNEINMRLGGGDVESFNSGDFGPGLRSTLSDGTTLVLRAGDSRKGASRITIEFQNKPTVKIRYR
ncbi:MAG: hypothetical protein Q6L60_11205 [Thermostichus sp. HHBFW_bins_43]